MKIALCLSGEPRYLIEGYNQLNQNILSKWKVDIFIHTWWEPSMSDSYMKVSPKLSYGRKYKWRKDTIELIYELYSPVKIEIEKPKIFQIFEDRDYELGIPNNLHSQFYSLHKSNILKCMNEKENKLIYDLVIRTRFDINFFKFNLDLSKIKNLQSIHAKIIRNNIINDQFCFSSSKNMDIYCNIFNKLNEYGNANFSYIDGSNGFVGERVMSHHLIKNNVRIYDLNLEQINFDIIKK
jgi:hypothetical protein